jgi:hypothetical protein
MGRFHRRHPTKPSAQAEGAAQDRPLRERRQRHPRTEALGALPPDADPHDRRRTRTDTKKHPLYLWWQNVDGRGTGIDDYMAQCLGADGPLRALSFTSWTGRKGPRR